jgi:SAM-dependent methyltransferase
VKYENIIEQLRTAYDARVDERERMKVNDWKSAVRQSFLERLQAEGQRTLVELGSGPGTHGRFFADAGLDVTCVDVSAAMVEACRAKGLDAYQQDFLHLDLPRRFDAGFALNCLLHVPPENLLPAGRCIAKLLLPGALLYVGQYGGIDWQGTTERDAYEPKRYFSLLSDERFRDVLGHVFEVVAFRSLDIRTRPDGWQFQSATLRKR